MNRHVKLRKVVEGIPIFQPSRLVMINPIITFRVMLADDDHRAFKRRLRIESSESARNRP